MRGIALALSQLLIGPDGSKAREMRVHPNDIVIYTLDGTTLRVIRVLHSRQRNP
jgi:plasmid stabilization system protein ParE